MPPKLEKRYEPREIENRWYRHWEKESAFSPSAEKLNSGAETYCIVLPPPNVTGTLHMGHAFQTSLIDTLIRYQGMMNKATLWQGGVDHAGIATQMVVERLLEREHSSRSQLGRKRFLDRVWQWKNHSGDTINQQLRRLGCAIDWKRERFTMSPEYTQGVIRAFCQLYHDGLIYRGQRLANWDPKLKTVVSDLEVMHTDEKGKMYQIRYPIADSKRSLIVSTTRPETLFGDSAVAVNPRDGRYQELIGKRVALPLCDKTIPIIADEAVDIDYGTGCLKITPAHDFNDFEIGDRHQLPMTTVMDRDACLNHNVPEPFQGLDRFDARLKVVEVLRDLGLLVAIDDHLIKIPRGDRSREILEPLLTKQWFVDLSSSAGAGKGGRESLVQPAIDAVKRGDIRFVPKHWENTYFRWMENIHDWCISRQIWWGHRIPAWYDDEGDIYVAENEEKVRERYKLGDDVVLTRDEDVLDTWFSSALWPFASLDWPREKDYLTSFYPNSVLVTGFDIIFFWVARMIIFGVYFQKEVPFREIYVHGLVRDGRRRKMSKSRGNIIDPLDLIEGIDLDRLIEKRTGNMMQPQMRLKTERQTRQDFPNGIGGYGCDSLRFAFNALASTGRDIPLDIKRIENGRNFCNKLWNAGRFLSMLGDDHPDAKKTLDGLGNVLARNRPEPSAYRFLANRWIVTRLRESTTQVHRYFSAYRFDLAAKCLYNFVWDDYCDWYIEIGKFVIASEADDSNPEERSETLRCLYQVYESALRLLHPIIPFITEEIHSTMFPNRDRDLGRYPYPHYPNVESRPSDIAVMDDVRGIIGAVRQARSIRVISPAKSVSLYLCCADPDRRRAITAHTRLIRRLAKLDEIRLGSDPSEISVPTSLHFYTDLQIHLPLVDRREVAAEQSRLRKDHRRLEQQFQSLNKRLDNANYLAKTPAEIVSKEKDKHTLLADNIAEINAQIDHLGR